jgi:hypothetical protein
MTSNFIPSDPRRLQSRRPPSPETPDLSLSTEVTCESCKNLTFEQVVLFRKVSALVSPTGVAQLYPVPTFACVACGHVNEIFRPAFDTSPTVSTEDSARSLSQEP